MRAQDMAKALRLSRSYYTQLESGSRRLTVDHLIRIAGALKVSLGEICADSSAIPIAAKRTFNHLVPINDTRLRKILECLLEEELESIEQRKSRLQEAEKQLAELWKSEKEGTENRRTGT